MGFGVAFGSIFCASASDAWARIRRSWDAGVVTLETVLRTKPVAIDVWGRRKRWREELVRAINEAMWRNEEESGFVCLRGGFGWQLVAWKRVYDGHFHFAISSPVW